MVILLINLDCQLHDIKDQLGDKPLGMPVWDGNYQKKINKEIHSLSAELLNQLDPGQIKRTVVKHSVFYVSPW